MCFDRSRRQGAAATLAALLGGGCDVAVSVTGPVSSDSMQASTSGEDSTGASSGHGPASTEIGSEESTGAGTGTADASTGDSTGGEESTGSALLPEGAPCDDAAVCDSSVCSPLGSCALACPCAADAACLGAACVEVGADGEGGDLAINDSPLGTMTPGDVDVYRVSLPAPGLYRVNVHGLGVTAWIVDASGAVLADPDDAVVLDDEGAMTARDFSIADAAQPVSVVIVGGPELDTSADYYFYSAQK